LGGEASPVGLRVVFIGLNSVFFSNKERVSYSGAGLRLWRCAMFVESKIRTVSAPVCLVFGASGGGRDGVKALFLNFFYFFLTFSGIILYIYW
jgi:hypothetical protein